jgi:hypothetical protein
VVLKRIPQEVGDAVLIVGDVYANEDAPILCAVNEVELINITGAAVANAVVLSN